MTELLFELFSEEIPARMQAKACDDLKKLMLAGFAEAGLTHGPAQAYATPRRLTLIVDGVAEATAATREELKGPKTSAPSQALDGFLRKTGLAKEQLQTRTDKKGAAFYVAVLEKPATPASDVVAQVAPAVIRGFPWPKSMRWGDGDLRWVRPLRAIVCILSSGKTAQIVPFEVAGVASGDITFGHRFMSADPKTGAPKPIRVTSATQYKRALEKAKVTLDPVRRANEIAQRAAALAAERGLELIDDPRLLTEVAGLVEHPVPLLGPISPEFQSLPPEVLRLSMKEHQKYFSALDPATGKITAFVTVANIATEDGGATILTGNERVLKARLSDAMFFYKNDLATPMDTMAGKLAAVTFHNRLGDQGARVRRIRKLAVRMAEVVGASAETIDRAAALAKADLVSEMVYEFPELQGYMGRVYAEAAGETPEVADAIAEHYAPLGPGDAAPSAPVSAAVALADKLDQLLGFWAVGAKPTGSGDPFALRRAALGVIRIVLENDLRLRLTEALAGHVAAFGPDADASADFSADVQADLRRFFAERFKTMLRDQGVRHDVIDAAAGSADLAEDLYLSSKRIGAVAALIAGPDGDDLVAAYKRANNILTAEETKDGVEYSLDPTPSLAETDVERALFKALDDAEAATSSAIVDEDFSAAAAAIARLRGPVDAFFETVVVNADTPTVRRNRLCLLNRLRRATDKIADFSVF